MRQLRIDQRDDTGWSLLVIVGVVDVATAPELRQRLVELQQVGGRRVALDLDGVEFLDSFGLGVIVGGLKRAATSGGELVVVCSRSRLTHLFAITGLDRVLRLTSSLEALASPDPSA